MLRLRVLAPMSALLLSGLLATACGGGTKISLALPDGDVVTKGGSVRVEATVDDYQDVPDGSSVFFRTNLGSFAQYSGDVTSPLQELEALTTGSKAIATLYSFPGEAGAATVTASYETENGTKSASVGVTIEGGTVPNGRNFTPACDTNNVAALIDTQDGRSERNNMKIRCELRASDINGDAIPKASIEWLVEEGCRIERYEEEGNLDLVVAVTPDCTPKDVEPMTDEPSQMVSSVIHNPRDGLLTIVFFTQGEEGYVDANSNKQYDAGENFAGYDLPEPFVDLDDNRERGDGSSGAPVEPFKDANGNGVWDRADGRWSADTMIWAATRIMFTGDPDGTQTTFSPNNLAIGNCDFENYTLNLVDKNLNPLAVHGAESGISFSDCGALTIATESIPMIANMGIAFLPDGSVETASFTAGRTYQIRMDDGNCEDPDETPPENCYFEATVTVTPGFAFGEYSPTVFSFTLPMVQGTVN
jgi:hypothetical protein